MPLGLHSIASNGSVAEIEKRLSGLPEKEQFRQINSYNINGFTPLHSAIFHDHPDIVSLLITHGANVNLPTHRTHWSLPIHLAALRSSQKIIQLLISAGADPSLCDWYGYNASEIAESSGNKAALQTLSLPTRKGDIEVGDLGTGMEDEWWRARFMAWDGEKVSVNDHYSDGGTPAISTMNLNKGRVQKCPFKLRRTKSQPLTLLEAKRINEESLRPLKA